VIPVGSSQNCGSISIIGDRSIESDEIFMVKITPAAEGNNVIIDTPLFTVMILNEDGKRTVTLYPTNLYQ
jgi:hypothetical protein